MATTIKIKETGELKELGIYTEDGIDWTNDFIGNSDGFSETGGIIWNEEDDVYEATQDNYEWWENVITAYADAEEKVNDYKAELGDNDLEIFINLLSGNMGCDLEDQPAQMLASIDEHKGEIN